VSLKGNTKHKNGKTESRMDAKTPSVKNQEGGMGCTFSSTIVASSMSNRDRGSKGSSKRSIIARYTFLGRGNTYGVETK
jgi:hypothetical protein